MLPPFSAWTSCAIIMCPSTIPSGVGTTTSRLPFQSGPWSRLEACARSARQRLLTSASVPRPSWRLRRMFFTVPFCSPVSADAPSVLLRSVSTVVEQYFKIRIQQAMTDEVASFSGGAAELNVHRLRERDGRRTRLYVVCLRTAFGFWSHQLGHYGSLWPILTATKTQNPFSRDFSFSPVAEVVSSCRTLHRPKPEIDFVSWAAV